MLPALVTLRELQDLDDALGVVEERIGAAPRALAGIDQDEKDARGRLEQAERDLEENGAARRRAEAELEDAEAAVEKYEGQLLGASSNVEYKGLQQQIGSARGRISDAEDLILKLMDDEGALTAARAEQRKEFTAAAARFEQGREKVRAAEQKARAERETLARRRKDAASRLAADLLGQYERVRAARKGQAVAVVSVDRCSACNVRLRPQLFEEVRTGRKVLACESCSRLLCYEAEAGADSGAEADAESAAAGRSPEAGASSAG